MEGCLKLEVLNDGAVVRLMFSTIAGNVHCTSSELKWLSALEDEYGRITEISFPVANCPDELLSKLTLQQRQSIQFEIACYEADGYPFLMVFLAGKKEHDEAGGYDVDDGFPFTASVGDDEKLYCVDFHGNAGNPEMVLPVGMFKSAIAASQSFQRREQ